MLRPALRVAWTYASGTIGGLGAFVQRRAQWQGHSAQARQALCGWLPLLALTAAWLDPACLEAQGSLRLEEVFQRGVSETVRPELVTARADGSYLGVQAFPGVVVLHPKDSSAVTRPSPTLSPVALMLGDAVAGILDSSGNSFWLHTGLADSFDVVAPSDELTVLAASWGGGAWDVLSIDSAGVPGIRQVDKVGRVTTAVPMVHLPDEWDIERTLIARVGGEVLLSERTFPFRRLRPGPAGSVSVESLALNVIAADMGMPSDSLRGWIAMWVLPLDGGTSDAGGPSQ